MPFNFWNGEAILYSYFFSVSVFEPESIRGQMVLSRWGLFKLFLATIASGM